VIVGQDTDSESTPYGAAMPWIWAIGALLAAMTASGADQSVYVLPLAAHGVAAGAIVLIARWRAAALVH
jgi:hypothetical protein